MLCDGNGKFLSPVCVCVCSFRRRDEPAVGSSEPCFFFFHVAVALFVLLIAMHAEPAHAGNPVFFSTPSLGLLGKAMTISPTLFAISMH